MDDKYNQLVFEMAQLKETLVKAEKFGLSDVEFESIIKEIESDGLFNSGIWCIGGEYGFNGLTFRGRSFLENNDRKQYSKIDKTEINYNHSVHVRGNNNGNIVTGNNNHVNFEFQQKINNVVEAIKQSNMVNKDNIIKDLNDKKNNSKVLKDYILGILSKGVEKNVSSTIGNLLSSLV